MWSVSNGRYIKEFVRRAGRQAAVRKSPQPSSYPVRPVRPVDHFIVFILFALFVLFISFISIILFITLLLRLLHRLHLLPSMEFPPRLLFLCWLSLTVLATMCVLTEPSTVRRPHTGLLILQNDKDESALSVKVWPRAPLLSFSAHRVVFSSFASSLKVLSSWSPGDLADPLSADPDVPVQLHRGALQHRRFLFDWPNVSTGRLSESLKNPHNPHQPPPHTYHAQLVVCFTVPFAQGTVQTILRTNSPLNVDHAPQNGPDHLGLCEWQRRPSVGTAA